MTTTSTSPFPMAAPWATGFEWPGNAALPSVPWELAVQVLTLQSTWWMACAAIQARWWQDAASTLGEQSPWTPWMFWPRGTEQLA